jgi:hypothetical protein
VHFIVVDELLFIYPAFIGQLKENSNAEAVFEVFADFKRACD